MFNFRPMRPSVPLVERRLTGPLAHVSDVAGVRAAQLPLGTVPIALAPALTKGLVTKNNC